jgi:hypothetical protein
MLVSIGIIPNVLFEHPSVKLTPPWSRGLALDVLKPTHHTRLAYIKPARHLLNREVVSLTNQQYFTSKI